MVSSAKKAVAALQGLKIMMAEFIFDTKIPNLKESVGNFVSQFDHSNYQRILKRVDDKKPEEDADPRTLVHTKNVQDYKIHLEDATIFDSPDYLFQLASAHALLTCKNYSRERGSVADPVWMANEARKIVASDTNAYIKEVRQIRGKELADLGMNLFWNVGKGAACDPICVIIHYQGRPENPEIDFGVVGKGVTYDTGGLNIKVMMMEIMYQDKGGACAVLGALQGCIDLGIKKNIVFACAFADNAIGADAFKPNDILTAMNGLTVEIGNTDAEGRLVMADTMTYIQRHYKPKKVAYIATLTGSCIIALGKGTAGLFSTDDEMVEAFEHASEDAFEPVWHMPLNDEHRDSVKGRYGADLNNIGADRWGGSCQAAAFLERFIEDERPWAHLDIAGPVSYGKSENGDASGYGAKLLLSYIDKCI